MISRLIFLFHRITLSYHIVSIVMLNLIDAMSSQPDLLYFHALTPKLVLNIHFKDLDLE